MNRLGERFDILNESDIKMPFKESVKPKTHTSTWHWFRRSLHDLIIMDLWDSAVEAIEKETDE